MGRIVKLPSTSTAGPKMVRVCWTVGFVHAVKCRFYPLANRKSPPIPNSLFFFFFCLKISTSLIRRRFSVTTKLASALGWNSSMKNDTVK